MKKAMFKFVVVLLGVWLIGKVGYSETHYKKSAEIIWSAEGEASALDEDGNTWNFEAEGLAKGDNVVLVMANYNLTRDVTDDEVEDVRVALN